jgi:hypothetical protein
MEEKNLIPHILGNFPISLLKIKKLSVLLITIMLPLMVLSPCNFYLNLQ